MSEFRSKLSKVSRSPKKLSQAGDYSAGDYSVGASSTGVSSAGFSLVEVMISMFVFTLLALATTQTLIFTKYAAENSLYEATSLNLGLSIIEQMKSAPYQDLTNPPIVDGNAQFAMEIDSGNVVNLRLGANNTLSVPIVTEAGGNQSKLLPVTVNPSITQMTEGDGLWLEVRYAYDHPRSGQTSNRVVRSATTDIRDI